MAIRRTFIPKVGSDDAREAIYKLVYRAAEGSDKRFYLLTSRNSGEIMPEKETDEKRVGVVVTGQYEEAAFRYLTGSQTNFVLRTDPSRTDPVEIIGRTKDAVDKAEKGLITFLEGSDSMFKALQLEGKRDVDL